MNILYIHQYFKTPVEPGGTRSYWIAQELIKSGHHVTMITSQEKGAVDREEKVIAGIKVVYLKNAYSQDMSIMQRLQSFLGFVWKSLKEARKQNNTDLVIATSTPLTVGITALYMKWVKKVPFIFEVRDLWPEVPIQMGALTNPMLVKSTRWFEKKIYKNATFVIALSPGMHDGVLKYIPREKTAMIPNMSKIDKFWPRQKDEQLEIELGLLPSAFKVIHFGALGLANGIDSVLNTARLMKDDKSVQFIFLGSGSTEGELKAFCEKEGMDNVFFLPKAPMEKTSEIVNFCDVSMVSFRDLPILYTNSPNKLFDSLSAGKPVIVNSAGWTKAMVEKYNCGYYVNPKNPDELADKIKYLQDHPEVVRQMGKNARKLAEEKYDKSILSRQFVNIVDGLDV